MRCAGAKQILIDLAEATAKLKCNRQTLATQARNNREKQLLLGSFKHELIDEAPTGVQDTRNSIA